MLRGRAILLVADRPDIADAVQGDGVILSAQGAHNHSHALSGTLQTLLPK